MGLVSYATYYNEKGMILFPGQSLSRRLVGSKLKATFRVVAGGVA